MIGSDTCTPKASDPFMLQGVKKITTYILKACRYCFSPPGTCPSKAFFLVCAVNNVIRGQSGLCSCCERHWGKYGGEFNEHRRVEPKGSETGRLFKGWSGNDILPVFELPLDGCDGKYRCQISWQSIPHRCSPGDQAALGASEGHF